MILIPLKQSDHPCQHCGRTIRRGERAYLYREYGIQKFVCLNCRPTRDGLDGLLSNPELRGQIRDILAIHGGGSVERQVRSDVKRTVSACASALIVFVGVPLGFLVLFYLLLMIAAFVAPIFH